MRDKRQCAHFTFALVFKNCFFFQLKKTYTNQTQCIVISHLLHAYYYFIFFSPSFFHFFASFIMFGIGCNIGIFLNMVFITICAVFTSFTLFWYTMRLMAFNIVGSNGECWVLNVKEEKKHDCAGLLWQNDAMQKCMSKSNGTKECQCVNRCTRIYSKQLQFIFSFSFRKE